VALGNAILAQVLHHSASSLKAVVQRLLAVKIEVSTANSPIVGPEIQLLQPIAFLEISRMILEI